MKTRAMLLFLFIGIVILYSFPGHGELAWENISFQNRINRTVSLPYTLSNFPLFVYKNATDMLAKGYLQNPIGWDAVFYDGSGLMFNATIINNTIGLSKGQAIWIVSQNISTSTTTKDYTNWSAISADTSTYPFDLNYTVWTVFSENSSVKQKDYSQYNDNILVTGIGASIGYNSSLPFGYSLFINSSGNIGANISDSAAMNVVKEFTARIIFTRFKSNGQALEVLLSKRPDASAGDREWEINLDNGVAICSGSSPTTPKAYCTIFNAAGSPRAIACSTDSILVNTTYDIQCRYNGVNNTIFINGKEEGSVAYTDSVNNGNYNITVGREFGGSTLTLNGTVSLVSYSNNARSNEWIAAEYWAWQNYTTVNSYGNNETQTVPTCYIQAGKTLIIPSNCFYSQGLGSFLGL